MEILLDVLISTIGTAGINRVVEMQLPQVEKVRYIVSWQMPGETRKLVIPEELKRADIIVSQIDSRGSSKNRNHAIAQSSAPYCLIADDDLRYTGQQLRAVIDTFDKNAELDLACFQYTGADSKTYPEVETDLTKMPRNFYPSTFEMAFRSARVKNRLQFNENFGIAAPYLSAGEDGMFLLEARRMGLRCKFYPITITHHTGPTTGYRPITDKGVILAEGAFIHKMYGLAGIPRLPLFVWRAHRNHRLKWWWGLLNITRGFMLSVRGKV